MKKGTVILLIIIGILLMAGTLFGSAYNSLVRSDEAVNSAWAQVENVYQRRLDLIPNLVETVKGYASHEKSTFTQVTEARARAAGSIASDVFNDSSKFARFVETQTQLASALSRLMAIVEQYPDLKASENFLSLQSQLEGTENRVAVERGRFNQTAQAFNTRVRQFPANIIASIFGFKPKEYFKADTQAQKTPNVKF